MSNLHSIRIQGSTDIEMGFPHINSYADLQEDLQDREAFFLGIQETIIDSCAAAQNAKLLQRLERQTETEAKNVLQLCKAINQRAWKSKGISDEQHEQAGDKAQKLFKEFKSTASELRDRREQKKKDRKINLLEFNAALFVAPLAAYTLFKIYFPEKENDLLCKGFAIVVFGAEIAYVFRKDAASIWRASIKQVTKRERSGSKKSFHRTANCFQRRNQQKATKGSAKTSQPVVKKPFRITKHLRRRGSENDEPTT